jgi:hypothetical protein
MRSLSRLLRPLLLPLGLSTISGSVLASVVLRLVALVLSMSLRLIRWTGLLPLRLLLRLLPLRRLLRRSWRTLLDLLARRRLSNGGRRRRRFRYILRLRRSYRHDRLRRDIKIEVVVSSHEVGERIASALKLMSLFLYGRRAKRRFLNRLRERNLTRRGSRSLGGGVVRVELLKKRIEIILIIVVRGPHGTLCGRRRRRHHGLRGLSLELLEEIR